MDNSPFETVNIKYKNVTFTDKKTEMQKLINKSNDRSRNNMTNITNNPYGSTMSKLSFEKRTQSTKKPKPVCNYSTEPSSAFFTRESDDK